jgi:hypothetical protein
MDQRRFMQRLARASLVLGSVMLTFSLHAESVAGLRWTAPAGWVSKGSTQMRAATYLVPPVAPDKEKSECAVYFFGQGQGGTIDANLNRWKGQFQSSMEHPAAANVRHRVVHGLAVTTIDTSGQYSGMGGPTATPVSPMANYRLLGAIVEGPQGNVFVKFTGPAKTMAASTARFEALINSFEKAQ